MKKKFFKKLFAFTLAEVLITLSILGVVAAITVPTLIKRQHRNEVETKIAKFYSTIDHALSVAEAEKGKGYAQWENINSYSAKVLPDYLKPYLNVASESSNDFKFKYADGTEDSNSNIKNGYICLKDGVCFASKTGTTYSVGLERDLYYDINGIDKGPNIAGKDVFYLAVFPNKKTGSYNLGNLRWNSGIDGYDKLLNGYGVSDYIDSCKKITSVSSKLPYCTAAIYMNHFKFPKDYPWL